MTTDHPPPPAFSTLAALPPFPALVWLVLLLIGGCSLLAMLHGMAIIVRAHMQAHDTRLKVLRLRHRYAAELANRQSTGDSGTDEILVVGEAPPLPPLLKKVA